MGITTDEHSPIGGSVAHRFIYCPAAPGRSKDIPDESGPDADRGVFAHGVGEMVLREGIKEVDRALIKSLDTAKVYVAEYGEMVGHVQKYVDAVRNVMESGDSFYVEHETALPWLHPDLWGTVDAWVLKPQQKHMYVIDFKYGFLTQEVIDNPQLKYYALGLLGEGNPLGIERITLVIVQPRATHPKGPVRIWEISVEELIAWGNEVLAPAAKATDDPSASVNVGPWCKYCPANTKTCQGVTEVAMSLPVVSNATMDEAMLVKVLEFSALYEPWIKKIKAGALQILVSGGHVPKHKLVRSNTSRRWVNEIAALPQLKCLHGDKVLRPYREELKRFGVLEKELPKGALKGLLVKPQGSLVMVPENDPRETEAVSPGGGFLTPIREEPTKKKESS